jgi:hypothetical protein
VEADACWPSLSAWPSRPIIQAIVDALVGAFRASARVFGCLALRPGFGSFIFDPSSKEEIEPMKHPGGFPGQVFHG